MCTGSCSNCNGGVVLTKEAERVAGETFAARALGVVRMAAKREMIEALFRQYSYAADHYGVDLGYKAKMEFMRDEMKRLLDNEANWKTL